MIGERSWCPDCRVRVVVVEEYLTSRMRARGEVEYLAVGLECGHGLAASERVVSASPGAPSVGPGQMVATSTRPVALAAARRERERQGLAGREDNG